MSFNITDEIHSQLKNCKETIKKDFFVIGLGGKESWITTLMANEIFGYYNVLAVNIYSIFSNSILPYKISALCQENNIQYCDVDITEAIQSTLSLPIGLFRIEKEKLHYMMTDLQKSEIYSMVRNIVLKGIADRHDGILLSGISKSKINVGWLSPNISMFDWNPIINCTHSQIKSVIKERNIGIDILDIPSGLDLNTKGGPFPSDYNINLDSDENKKDNKIINLGYGIYQKC